MIGAILLRFLTAEQSYGVVGLMRTLGMTSDQMQPLFMVILLGMLIGVALSAITFGVPNMGKQIVVAIALFAVAAFLDHHRSSVDRPSDFFFSQFLLAVGSGVFMGPLMLTGIIQGLKFGANHMLTAVVTISMTQAMGGLLGSALLSTYQTYREQIYSVALVAQMDPTDPVVAERLKIQNQIYGKVTPDPAMRANQGTLQLSQIVRREANVRAYNDVFALTAAIALLYLLWSLGASARVRQAAAMVRAMTRQSGNQVAAAAGTDGTPQRAPSVAPVVEPEAANAHEPDVSQRVTVVVQPTATDAYGDVEEGAQAGPASPARTVVIEGAQATHLAAAAQAAETREQAVLASRDPLQDNAQALELEAELEQEIDKNARSSPAADDGGRDGSGPQARNSNR